MDNAYYGSVGFINISAYTVCKNIMKTGHDDVPDVVKML